ncbi:putative glycine-rich cell wall structural protein 1 [Asparagus officinalis]|nr:putative glycine-rich cell wall structural protein 1 [Asparagus officinalis]
MRGLWRLVDSRGVVMRQGVFVAIAGACERGGEGRPWERKEVGGGSDQGSRCDGCGGGGAVEVEDEGGGERTEDGWGVGGGMGGVLGVRAWGEGEKAAAAVSEGEGRGWGRGGGARGGGGGEGESEEWSV